ncbi:MAG TPA: hypothetical protein VIU93_15410 [Gallionellaceae bacterium]
MDQVQQQVVKKVKITRELIDDWTVEAISLYESGASEAEIAQHLKDAGCTPLIRNRIIQDARSNVKSVHRRLGMRAIFIGVAMLGASLLFFYLIGSSSSHVHVPGRTGGKGALALLLLGLGGVVMTILGLIKFFTGSTMDVELDSE